MASDDVSGAYGGRTQAALRSRVARAPIPPHTTRCASRPVAESSRQSVHQPAQRLDIQLPSNAHPMPVAKRHLHHRLRPRLQRVPYHLHRHERRLRRILRAQPRVTAPAEHQARVDLVSARYLHHRHARNPRLRHNLALLLLRPRRRKGPHWQSFTPPRQDRPAATVVYFCTAVSTPSVSRTSPPLTSMAPVTMRRTSARNCFDGGGITASGMGAASS